ncbi:MAG: hypothetical protein M1828_007066 [Chrysothrix sp. TS-e1954]|nr:MAG: hypothetical protein M1828_007066 [Chrysothrix sp. TS-e1954]
MATHTSWDAKTSGTQVAETFSSSIRGKTILITGVGPNGLGEELAQILSSQSPKLLIFTARSKSKAEQVAANIKVPTKVVQLDVSSFVSVKDAVSHIDDNIDIIFNNAGVMNLPARELSVDGLEMHLATNYVGLFLFTNLLVARMVKSGRIVNIVSNGYAISPFRFHDPNFEHSSRLVEDEKPIKPVMEAFGVPYSLEYTGPVAYGQSKTAAILYTKTLAQKLKDRDVIVTCLNPGAIATDIWRQLPKEQQEQFFKGLPMKSKDEGASTPLVAALDPKLASASGCYLDDCQVQGTADFASSDKLANELWAWTEKTVGASFIF